MVQTSAQTQERSTAFRISAFVHQELCSRQQLLDGYRLPTRWFHNSTIMAIVGIGFIGAKAPRNGNRFFGFRDAGRNSPPLTADFKAISTRLAGNSFLCRHGLAAGECQHFSSYVAGIGLRSKENKGRRNLLGLCGPFHGCFLPVLRYLFRWLVGNV